MRSTLAILFALTAGAVMAIGAIVTSGSAAEEARRIPPPKTDEAPRTKGATEVAIFAGGCFWGVQGVFQHVRGVRSAVSGYAGGGADTAAYQMVGTGRTGHAESVAITFDPSEVSYGTLLQIYFSVAHDPTELDRQGPDSGTQYRSTIFPTTPEQQKVAAAYIAELNDAKAFPAPIVTTVEPGKKFFPAEDYHQNFLTLNPTYPYIVVNDMPKIAALKAVFPQSYREAPVLVATTKLAN